MGSGERRAWGGCPGAAQMKAVLVLSLSVGRICPPREHSGHRAFTRTFLYVYNGPTFLKLKRCFKNKVQRDKLTCPRSHRELGVGVDREPISPEVTNTALTPASSSGHTCRPLRHLGFSKLTQVVFFPHACAHTWAHACVHTPQHTHAHTNA